MSAVGASDSREHDGDYRRSGRGPQERQGLVNSFGSLAILAAMRRASLRVSSGRAARRLPAHEKEMLTCMAIKYRHGAKRHEAARVHRTYGRECRMAVRYAGTGVGADLSPRLLAKLSARELHGLFR